MKQTFYALALLGLTTACSKSSSPAPAAPTHTLRLDYSNRGLNTTGSNLGAGFRAQADGKPLMLGGVVDETYYISQPDASSITYPSTHTFTGSTLTLEVGFYNLTGGSNGQPLKNASGNTITLPSNALLGLQATVDGKVLNTATTVPVLSMSGGLSYDNGKNPTKTITIDLTKI